MYQPRAVPDSQDDPAFGRVPSLPSPEKRGAALGPTQGQVDARRNLSVSAEIVSAETFALWCDATRVESVDDCLAKSGQSALRLVPVHHSDPETADFCEGARERSRAVDHHDVRYEFPIGSYWPIIRELKMHARARLSIRASPPTSSTRRTTPASPRRGRDRAGARPAEDGTSPSRHLRVPLRTIRWTSAWTVCLERSATRSIPFSWTGCVTAGARRQMSRGGRDGRGQDASRSWPARVSGRRPASGGGSREHARHVGAGG